MPEKVTSEGFSKVSSSESNTQADPFATLKLFGTVGRIPNNLPTPPTPLIGREKELNAAQELVLLDDMRLVTLTGSGGTGKTRLAVELAAAVLNNINNIYINNISGSIFNNQNTNSANLGFLMPSPTSRTRAVEI